MNKQQAADEVVRAAVEWDRARLRAQASHNVPLHAMEQAISDWVASGVVLTKAVDDYLATQQPQQPRVGKITAWAQSYFAGPHGIDSWPEKVHAREWLQQDSGQLPRNHVGSEPEQASQGG